MPCLPRQVGQLKSERDRYARALLREVGDEVPMERVLDEGSDWKGRAQQISLLRDKVREASLQQVREDCRLPALANAPYYPGAHW